MLMRNVMMVAMLVVLTVGLVGCKGPEEKKPVGGPKPKGDNVTQGKK